MLKKITKWETEDGEVFDTQEEAEDYMFEQEKEVMTHTSTEQPEPLRKQAAGSSIRTLNIHQRILPNPPTTELPLSAYCAAPQTAQPVAWLAEYVDREGNSKWYVSTHKDLATENDKEAEPKPLYTHPTQQGLEKVERRQLEIGKAVERACKELPEGAGITISLERGAGMVEMIDWHGNEFDHFDEEHEDFADRINAAIDGAIAAEQVAAQAKQEK